MFYTLNAMIYPGDERGFVAECVELPVVTQGETLDEVVQNLREAVSLHIEGESPADNIPGNYETGSAVYSC